jgi:hypothetical protein
MHSGEDREAVVRLYERLAEALQRTRPAGFDAPVSVAEIYQELVPYRAVRSEVGFGMNADYEHVLLRLLAGEAELVRIEPDTAREEILRELRSTNPNVSIYRAYAGCDVWVRPLAGAQRRTAAAPPPAAAVSNAPKDADAAQPRAAPAGAAPAAASPRGDAVAQTSAVPADAASAGGGPAAQTRAVPADAASSGSGVAAQTRAASAGAAPMGGGAAGPSRAMTPAAAVRDVAAAAQSRPSVSGAAGVGTAGRGHGSNPADAVAAGARAGAAPRTECVFCESLLPAHRAPRYCPYCGADQTTRPCRACGEPLEPGWAFCVACGSADPRAAGA